MSRIFKIEIDLASIDSSFNVLSKEMEAALLTGVQKLAVATHAHIIESVQSELHTTREKYLDALTIEEIASNIYIISIDMDKVGWLEDGKAAGSMVDDLLKNKAKISKKGLRYKTIPFEYSKSPDQISQKSQQYVSLIKSELKKRQIPYKKIELNPDGSPRIGRLHSFDIDSPYPSAKAKTPALHGLAIYQRKDPKSGKIRRDIMTFRTVSDKHKEEGLWYHPGIKPKQFFENAVRWAMELFETDILPNILNQIN